MIPNEEDIKYFNRRILGEKNIRPNCNYSFGGKTLIEAQDKIDELKQQLEASQKLSEERRVALIGFDEDGTFCSSCGYDARIHSNHELDCDYIRLCKKD